MLAETSDAKEKETLQSLPKLGAEKDEPKLPGREPDTFKNINDLIKALAWPVLLLYVLVRYQAPLAESINLVPTLIKQTTKVTAGSVTFEIEQKAQASGNEALTKALKGLSPEARKLLLQIGDSYWTRWNAENLGDKKTYFATRITALNELSQRGLVDYNPEGRVSFDQWVRSLGEISSFDSGGDPGERLIPSRPLTSEEEKRLFAQRFHLSSLGHKAYSVILDVVVNS